MNERPGPSLLTMPDAAMFLPIHPHREGARDEGVARREGVGGAVAGAHDVPGHGLPGQRPTADDEGAEGQHLRGAAVVAEADRDGQDVIAVRLVLRPVVEGQADVPVGLLPGRRPELGVARRAVEADAQVVRFVGGDVLGGEEPATDLDARLPARIAEARGDVEPSPVEDDRSR